MDGLQAFAQLLNTALLIGIGVGGYFAFRSGKSRTANEVQSHVIEALQAEVDSLSRRMDEVMKENVRLGQIITTMRSALKKSGLAITLDGQLVSIASNQAISIQQHIQGS